jgi:hypothetical protein
MFRKIFALNPVLILRLILQDKTLHGPKAGPVELNLWTMLPMSTTTRAMLEPEADEVDGQTDTEGLKS